MHRSKQHPYSITSSARASMRTRFEELRGIFCRSDGGFDDKAWRSCMRAKLYVLQDPIST
jgi:hypothetical protein